MIYEKRSVNRYIKNSSVILNHAGAQEVSYVELYGSDVQKMPKKKILLSPGRIQLFSYHTNLFIRFSKKTTTYALLL